MMIPRASSTSSRRSTRAAGFHEPLARQVAVELSKGDRLAIHARDELGLEAGRQARPLPSGVGLSTLVHRRSRRAASGNCFAPTGSRAVICVVLALVGLGLLGSLGAALGGAPRMRAAARVLVWGAIAMAATSGIGALAGAVV